MVRLVTALLVFATVSPAFAQSVQSFPEFAINTPGHELVYLNATSTLGEPETITIYYAMDGEGGGLIDISATIPAGLRVSVPMNGQQLLTGTSFRVGFLRVTCSTCKAQLVMRPRPIDTSETELTRFRANPLYINPVP